MLGSDALGRPSARGRLGERGAISRRSSGTSTLIPVFLILSIPSIESAGSPTHDRICRAPHFFLAAGAIGLGARIERAPHFFLADVEIDHPGREQIIWQSRPGSSKTVQNLMEQPQTDLTNVDADGTLTTKTDLKAGEEQTDLKTTSKRTLRRSNNQ
jgi:hypothetical protein